MKIPNLLFEVEPECGRRHTKEFRFGNRSQLRFASNQGNVDV